LNAFSHTKEFDWVWRDKHCPSPKARSRIEQEWLESCLTYCHLCDGEAEVSDKFSGSRRKTPASGSSLYGRENRASFPGKEHCPMLAKRRRKDTHLWDGGVCV
jgi:hypothetical protein